MVRRDKKQPVYMISVVSELLGVHPQTLRLYEREGLIRPKRVNNQRLYSEEDLERLSFILELTRDLGVNRAGVEIILRMQRRMVALQEEIGRMLGCLEGDLRREFERRIRKILSE
ncbi:MAG: MerR family transcriptional regulator [Nitrospirae bacterium]|nr:MAG: MerR family transcriptional regulator [Nitrospirota bacterium]